VDFLGLSVFCGFERRVDCEQRTVGNFEVSNLQKKIQEGLGENVATN